LDCTAPAILQLPPAPKGRKNAKGRETQIGPDDCRFDLDFFSTFEELTLPIKGPMEDAGVVRLYEPSLTPYLYMAHAQNMVGRIQLVARVFETRSMSHQLELMSAV
jgi:hypothetical protein